ncbi:MAG: LysR family transcriptional regulator [Clostridia bacterium]|nr:LysR family transcriptional regulator [Clostridia bacterium]
MQKKETKKRISKEKNNEYRFRSIQNILYSCKTKNISKSAKSMYISQSAITQSIQKLEGYLGFKVFYRKEWC